MYDYRVKSEIHYIKNVNTLTTTVDRVQKNVLTMKSISATQTNVCGNFEKMFTKYEKSLCIKFFCRI